jgi:hypothetical protein
MPPMWYARSGANPRAGRERKPCSRRKFRERKGIELRHNLAQEPSLIAIGAVAVSRPAAIATMLLGIGHAALVPGPIARAPVSTSSE